MFSTKTRDERTARRLAALAVPRGGDYGLLVPIATVRTRADAEMLRAVLREVLTPLAGAGADQLVLGCTHYPFLAQSIRAEFGDHFALVDSGVAVARHTRDVLCRAGLRCERTHPGEVRYLVTGDPAAARPVIETLVGQERHNVTVQQVTT